VWQETPTSSPDKRTWHRDADPQIASQPAIPIAPRGQPFPFIAQMSAPARGKSHRTAASHMSKRPALARASSRSAPALNTLLYRSGSRHARLGRLLNRPAAKQHIHGRELAVVRRLIVAPRAVLRGRNSIHTRRNRFAVPSSRSEISSPQYVSASALHPHANARAGPIGGD